MSGVLCLDCEEDRRGVFGVELSLKETRGEVLLDRVEADLAFVDDTC